MLSTAIRVAVYMLALYGLYLGFTPHADPFHLSLLAGSAAVLTLSVVLAALAAQDAVEYSGTGTVTSRIELSVGR